MKPEYELIDQPAPWTRCLDLLRSAKRFAVDLEANSLHAYRESVCLIQISTDSHNYIVDPLSGLDLSGLAELLADPAVEKVFHAIDYDLTLLKGRLNWEVHNLFDTMWAGRVLGLKNMGLAVFLKELFGVELSKKHQKANWGRRPLTPELLEYAANDTHYLLPLRDNLEQQLVKAGLLVEAQEIFAAAVEIDPSDRVFDPESFRSIRGARDLPQRAQAILRSLFIFRDEEARRRDVPPFKVANDLVLVRLAEYAATHPGSLAEAPTVSPRLIERLGSRLQQAIEQGRRGPLPKVAVRPLPRKNSPGFSQRYEALLEMRKRIARERGVESDVIMTRRTAVEIAEKNPRSSGELEQIESLGPYRRERYAEEILRAIEELGA